MKQIKYEVKKVNGNDVSTTECEHKGCKVGSPMCIVCDHCEEHLGNVRTVKCSFDKRKVKAKVDTGKAGGDETVTAAFRVQTSEEMFLRLELQQLYQVGLDYIKQQAIVIDRLQSVSGFDPDLVGRIFMEAADNVTSIGKFISLLDELFVKEE